MATDMDRHYSAGQLARYALPSIAMVAFASIYGIIDGLFVSNFAGTTAFAAVNIIMPFIMILAAAGTMIGTGGGAVVGATRGSGRGQLANAQFTLFVIAAAAAGLLFAIIGAVFMRPISGLLGATPGSFQDQAVLYGSISMISLPFFILQYAFQELLVTAGKPKLGLGIMVASGCMNIVLDAVLVGALDWGVAGAAIATVTSEYVGGLLPVLYFASKRNTSHLKLLGRRELRRQLNGNAPDTSAPHLLGKACGNGSSEMVTTLSQSVVAMLYNLQLMAYAGQNGVAAYGVIMYVFMIFSAVYIGYSMACAPLVSYQRGAARMDEVGSLLRKSLGLNAAGGVVMLAFAQLSAPVVAQIFVGYDPQLAAYTEHGFRLYSCAFLIMGISIYSSGFFTALGNGKVSALISFLRTFVFEAGCVLLLPGILGADGIWLAIDVAECASVIISLLFIFGLRKVYGYSLRPAQS
ncbi:MAG: MATE family efflux transporter [Eggerthellaceae bacterium]|jgi:Na+-driven multidrug efflux pump